MAGEGKARHFGEFSRRFGDLALARVLLRALGLFAHRHFGAALHHPRILIMTELRGFPCWHCGKPIPSADLRIATRPDAKHGRVIVGFSCRDCRSEGDIEAPRSLVMR
jgi:hypothetical protein